MEKITPLRIPYGWAVLYNSFFEDDMIIKNNKIENYLSFKEDLLFIKECRYSNEDYRVIPDGYELYLGWFPDSNPNGKYRLLLIKGEMTNILIDYKSKDKRMIVKVIESCLHNLLTVGFNKEKILSCTKD